MLLFICGRPIDWDASGDTPALHTTEGLNWGPTVEDPTNGTARRSKSTSVACDNVGEIDKVVEGDNAVR